MRFKKFVNITLEKMNKYYHRLYYDLSNGRLELGDGKLLFPNVALFTQTNDHFLFEVFGASEDFTELKVVQHKCPSTATYLGQFNIQKEAPIFELGARDIVFSNLLFSREIDRQAVRKRFGFVSDMWKTTLNFKGKSGAIFGFNERFQSCFINSCLIINKYNEIYRLKHILYAAIVSKKHSKIEYLNDLQKKLNEPLNTTDHLYGVHYISSPPYSILALSGQFASIFLFPELRETKIGEFFEKQPNFTKNAFHCKNYVYNKRFKWMNGNPNPEEKFIQPDIMLERKDGFFDICDLKTALLGKQRITKGGHRRRRFIDYVEEGIAQLANYEEYFKFKRNADWALSKYGVKVHNPNLILVVGSYENASKEEIMEASRKLKPNYRIVDYDTLNSIFLSQIRQVKK